MTTEIALLNKHAVVLAADSAVTYSGPDASKIYNSANKLFTLSKHHPVGIMIYNNADLCGVPWETLIKIYRKNLGDTSFPTIKDYTENFISFLQNNFRYFKENEYSFLKNRIFELMQFIYKESTSNQCSPSEIIEYLLTIPAERLNCVSESDYNTLINLYRPTILEQIDQLQTHMGINVNESKDQLVNHIIGAYSNKSEMFESGVVISGFGDDELFPSITETRFYGALNNRVFYSQHSNKSISLKMPSIIDPFAQQDMIQTLLNGLNNEMGFYVTQFFQESLTELKQQDNDPAFSITPDQELFLVNKFFDKIVDYTAKNYTFPTRQAVKLMPKEELAEMAEALVQVTSLKRRMSNQEESVGGPVDVAIISKGDGFIWIKRKHYFKPELNRPQFFSNYLKN